MISGKILIYFFIVIFICIFLCVIIYRTYNLYTVDYSKYLVPKKLYPNMEKIWLNKEDITKELTKILFQNKWIDWTNSPDHLNVSETEMLTYIGNNCTTLDDITKKRKIYGLILNNKVLVNGLIFCPRLTVRLSKIPEVINAGFQTLESGKEIINQIDLNSNVYRCYIPLICPKQKSGIQIIDNDYQINLNDCDYYIFNQKYPVREWNTSNEFRISLVIDIKKQ